MARVGVEKTYNSNLASKLILDFALLDGVRRLIFDDGEKLFNTHLCGCGSCGARFRFSVVILENKKPCVTAQ